MSGNEKCDVSTDYAVVEARKVRLAIMAERGIPILADHADV